LYHFESALRVRLVFLAAIIGVVDTGVGDRFSSYIDNHPSDVPRQGTQ
jgi:hypothetical protein